MEYLFIYLFIRLFIMQLVIIIERHCQQLKRIPEKGKKKILGV